jgi:elongation factor G
VIFSSGLGNIGADRVMDFIVDYTPAPSEHEWVQGEPAPSGNGDAPKRHETDAEPVSLYVFKTVSDAFAGKDFLFQSLLRRAEERATMQNFSRGSAEKLSHISIMQGKTAVPVTELHAGDIGAVAKLKDTLTGDTLGRQGCADSVSASEAAGAGDHVCH